MFKSKKNNQESLLANADNDYSVQSQKDAPDDENIDDKNGGGRWLCFSWKCCCLSSFLTLTVAILTVFLVLYFSVAPKFAQSVLDNASMIVVNGTISNPTNSSVTMTTTIMISNAGFLDGSISSFPVTVSSEDIEFGHMTMPEMNTIANSNTMVTATSVLTITNLTQFKRSTAQLLSSIDQVWHVESTSDVTLTVDTGIMGKVDYTVNVAKDLELKGVNLYDLVASNLNVASATNEKVYSVTDLNLISKSIFTFELPDAIMEIYQDGIYLGYSPLAARALEPGLNTIHNQSLVVEATAENEELLNAFFSGYIAGDTQRVVMKGPVPGTVDGVVYPVTVLDGVLEETILALGYQGGELAFGGLVTSATQQGWKVSTTGETVRGAYANFLNPLNVPVKIVNMTGVARLPKENWFDYHVQILVTSHECHADTFAALSIGPGIWKNNASKTWVDVGPNEKSTYFTIANPVEGTHAGNCMGQYPFDCCFATMSQAYACYLNPEIRTKPSDGQLYSDYMPMELNANVTMWIDNQFAVTVNTVETFPLYFGWQVYGGYFESAEVSCTSYKFYDYGHYTPSPTSS